MAESAPFGDAYGPCRVEYRMWNVESTLHSPSFVRESNGRMPGRESAAPLVRRPASARDKILWYAKNFRGCKQLACGPDWSRAPERPKRRVSGSQRASVHGPLRGFRLFSAGPPGRAGPCGIFLFSRRTYGSSRFASHPCRDDQGGSAAPHERAASGAGLSGLAWRWQCITPATRSKSTWRDSGARTAFRLPAFPNNPARFGHRPAVSTGCCGNSHPAGRWTDAGWQPLRGRDQSCRIRRFRGLR